MVRGYLSRRLLITNDDRTNEQTNESVIIRLPDKFLIQFLGELFSLGGFSLDRLFNRSSDKFITGTRPLFSNLRFKFLLSFRLSAIHVRTSILTIAVAAFVIGSYFIDSYRFPR